MENKDKEALDRSDNVGFNRHRIPLKKRPRKESSLITSSLLMTEEFVNEFWQVNEDLHKQARLNSWGDEIKNDEGFSSSIHEGTQISAALKEELDELSKVKDHYPDPPNKEIYSLADFIRDNNDTT